MAILWCTIEVVTCCVIIQAKLNVAETNDSDMFSLRIVSADHYMAEPCPGVDVIYSEFRTTKIFRLPVIRLYGPTRLGNCIYDLYEGQIWDTPHDTSRMFK